MDNHPESPSDALNGSGPAVGNADQRAAELRDFVENVAVPLHWVGEDGTIIWANGAEMNFLGYSREEYIGHNIAEFHADRSVIDDILARLKNDEKLTRYEARMVCKDGSIRYVAISSSVYREEGRFVHTRCVTLDITDQKRMNELQQRLAAIVESSDDAIISKDLDGFIKSWNSGAEHIFGYTAEEIIGKHISILAAPDKVDEIPGILDRIKRGERVEHFQTKRRTKDGRILTISLTVSPIRDTHGVVIGASKVARDIAELERREKELRELNEALTQSNADLEQFAYSASHDLQEPLRMVVSYTELLMQQFGDQLGPEAAEYAAYALQGAMRMEQLLQDLRAYTLVSTSNQEPTEYLDANSALQKALANLEAEINESGATVTSTSLPRVLIHEFQLEQLFQNLIGNAIRYKGKAPPDVKIDANRQGGEWVFSLQDNGIGIAREYKEKVFEIFKRLHTVAEYPGTGMGLAICKRIVERAGGRIWVESEVGRGSTFYFTLPQ